MKRFSRSLAVAAVLIGVGTMDSTPVGQQPAPPGGALASMIRPGVAADEASIEGPAAETAAAPGPAAEAAAACDLDAPVAAVDEAAETEQQARHDRALARRLMASGSPVERAVASLLGRLSDRDPRELREEVDAGARAAVLSSDPKLYSLALVACGRLRSADSPMSAPESCSQLSGSRLPLIDPDNALVWLMEARSARQHHDAPAELNAVYQAAQAHRYERPTAEAQRVLLAAMPATDPAWLRYGALRQLTGAISPSTRWSLSHEAADLSASCDVEELHEPNRRGLCENLARNLLDRSANADSLWPGAFVAMELGWSDERLKPYLSQTLPMFMAREALTPFPPHGCRAGVELAILEAAFATDSPTRLRAPGLQAAIRTLTAARQAAEEEAENAGRAAEETKGAEAKEKSSEAEAKEKVEPPAAAGVAG